MKSKRSEEMRGVRKRVREAGSREVAPSTFTMTSLTPTKVP